MLTPAHRLYIASPDAERLERLFDREPAFSVLGSSGQGREALNEIFSLSPDALLLDGALPGLDGLNVLDMLRTEMVAPPRVLYLCRVPGNAWADLAREKGADQVCFPEKESDEALLCRALSAARAPLPALAGEGEGDRMEIAAGLLDRLDVPRRLKGWGYIQTAAACLACAPQLGQSFSHGLYPFLAGRFQTAPQAVERAIRTAVEHTWLRGDLTAIQALFGFSVDADRGKPTNAEFLSMLAEHVRREMARTLLKRRADAGKGSKT